MFAALGIEVTVVDKRERPLEFLDGELVDELLHQMRNAGVTFRLGEAVERLEIVEGPSKRILIFLESGKRLVSDLVLFSAGRQGATDRLNLPAAGLKADDRGRLTVDQAYRTSVPHIFAAREADAFFGAGYGPDSGKYKHVIRQALEYLMAREQANGNYLTNDLVGGYTRPLGAQALAEAYSVTGDKRYAWHAQRSIDFLTTIQNRLGGWRYRVNIETTDTSCMSWNLFALKMGEKAGLTVQEIALAGCYQVMDLYSTPVEEHREEFLDIDPDYGYEVGRDTTYTYETGYQNAVWDSKYATVPLGIMCRIFLGWRRSHPFCIGSANKILEDMMEEIPRGENWSLYRSFREYPTYAWYYGTLAMHQMGGRYFRLWNERIKKVVPGTQEQDGCIRGSWPMWNHDSFNGRVVMAALGALTLETYYRYLPVLQD